MKKTILPRAVAAITSMVIALFLLDQVATMGQSADQETAAVRTTGYQVAVAGR